MEIKTLTKKPDNSQNTKLQNIFSQFERLLAELKKMELPDNIIISINSGIEQINAASGAEKEWIKQIKRTQTAILKILEKELKLVTKDHYRNTWLAVGMSVFGIPLGFAFGMSLDNMGLLGLGLPIGMAIGLAVGSAMDKKAQEEGRQLDLVIKY
ncbi:MAG: hypothetical protein RIA69_05140 [Cyclobacteriaceae bacterium]